MKKKASILLVDDDPVFLFLHEKLLKKCGINVDINKFCDGRQALDFIEHNHQGSCFYVLLDINMPVMNGWEFLRSIQSLPYNTHISVFIVSSATQDGEREQEKDFSQITGSFNKPLTLADCVIVDDHLQNLWNCKNES